MFKPRVTGDHPVLLGSFEPEKTRVCGIPRGIKVWQRVAGPQCMSFRGCTQAALTEVT